MLFKESWKRQLICISTLKIYHMTKWSNYISNCIIDKLKEVICWLILIKQLWCLIRGQSWFVSRQMLGWEPNINPIITNLVESLWVAHKRSWWTLEAWGLSKLDLVWILDWESRGLKRSIDLKYILIYFGTIV